MVFVAARFETRTQGAFAPETERGCVQPRTPPRASSPARLHNGSFANPLGVLRDQRLRERVLGADDLAPVLLEGGLRAALAKHLALAQKPSNQLVEGFYGERVPARGGCGRRG